jgi:hypothetical protein
MTYSASTAYATAFPYAHWYSLNEYELKQRLRKRLQCEYCGQLYRAEDRCCHFCGGPLSTNDVGHITYEVDW